MTQYTESGTCTIRWEADQFDNVQLTNSKGHTFTAKSEGLHDFISYEDDRLVKEKQALLDDFAKAAMQASMSNEELRKSLILDARQAGISVDEFIARDAYDIASAMMQERERRMKG